MRIQFLGDLLFLAQAESDPSQVTRAWMAGVVGMMILFGVFALIGYVRKKFAKK